MISLTCTKCRKVLQIDDAFAGGVCRCQFCGTIQTVPAKLKPTARPGAPAATKPKAPPPPPPPVEPTSTATPIATAEPEPDRETRIRAASPTPQKPPRFDANAVIAAFKANQLPILLIIGVGLVLIVGMILWLSSLKHHMPPPQ